jgi:hypothetical protein
MGRCIVIRHVGSCAYGVDFTRSPSAARWVYATSRTLSIPSVSKCTVNGYPVVAIGVRRRGVGSDNSSRRGLPCLRFLVGTVRGMAPSSRVHGKRYLQVTFVEGLYERLHEGFILVQHQISCLVWKWDGTRRPRPTRVSRWPERSWSPARSSRRRYPTQLEPGALGCTPGRSG